MRKYLLITLVDGQQFERDIPVVQSIPVGAKANDRVFLGFCMQIATQGFCEDPLADRPRWVAPTQVKWVEVVFEQPLTVHS